MISRISLRTKLLSGLAAVILLTSGLAAFLVNGLAVMADELRDMHTHNTALSVAALELQVNLGDLDGEFSRAVYSSDARTRIEADRGLMQFLEDGEDIRAEIETVGFRRDADQTLWAQYLTEYDELVATWTQAVTLAGAGNLEAAQAMDAQAVERWQQAAGVLAEIVANVQANAEAQYLAAEDAYTSLRITAIAASLLFSMLAAFGGWAMTSRVSRQVGSAASQLNRASQEGANQANVVASAGEQVSHNVQTVATAVEEMTASVSEIARAAGEASRVAEQARCQVEQTNGNMLRLGESSGEIGKVTEVIIGIADQTKLLALNATIEAARAGEAGKGFAVVANEVKDLANATAAATEQISSRIQAMQQNTTDTVTAIADISEVVARIAAMQETIAAAVEEQNATTSEISSNINEAALGSSEIAENILNMASAAGELGDVAAKLQAAVGGSGSSDRPSERSSRRTKQPVPA